MDRICLTDDPTLSSSSWQMRVIPRRLPADTVRSARRCKILAHEYLPEYDETLYVDNTVELRTSPEAVFDALLPESSAMALLRHSWHGPLREEFDDVRALGLDVDWRCQEQIHDYARTDPDGLEAPTLWTGILLRRHRDPSLQSLMSQWWEHVLRYSRRDQLSLPFLLRQSDAAVTVHDLDNHESRFHVWPRWMGTKASSRRVVPQWDGPGHQIEQLHEAAAVLGDEIAGLRVETAGLRDEILGLRDELAAQLDATDAARRAQHDASRASHLAQRDAAIASEEAKELGRQLAQSHLDATTRSNELAALRRELAVLRAEIDELRASTSWKMTRPLRLAGSLLRPNLDAPDADGTAPGG